MRTETLSKNLEGTEVGRPRCRQEDNIKMYIESELKVYTGFN
jgi:hypothetical protein